MLWRTLKRRRRPVTLVITGRPRAEQLRAEQPSSWINSGKLPELRSDRALVAVVLGLERALGLDADIGSLLVTELGELRIEPAEMKLCDLLVEMLR